MNRTDHGATPGAHPIHPNWQQKRVLAWGGELQWEHSESKFGEKAQIDSFLESAVCTVHENVKLKATGASGLRASAPKDCYNSRSLFFNRRGLIRTKNGTRYTTTHTHLLNVEPHLAPQLELWRENVTKVGDGPGMILLCSIQRCSEI